MSDLAYVFIMILYNNLDTSSIMDGFVYDGREVRFNEPV